jgi:hypothetical protein
MRRRNNMILPMSASHIDHDKLVKMVYTIEQEAKGGLFDPLNTQYNQAEFNRINDLYDDTRVGGIIRPIYQGVTYVDEEKIDGFSYTNVNGEFFSRKLSEARESKGQPICKTGHIPHLASTLKSMATVCEFNVHGELYKPGGTSDDVTKIMGCAEDKAIARQHYPEDKLHYMIHDIMSFNGHDLTNEPWYVRRAILEYWFTNYMLEDGFIHLSKIEGSPVKSFNRIVSAGGEGLMFKKTNGLYVPGKKPANNWIKCKKEITLDAVFMGLDYDGSGKNKDLFKSIEIGLWDESNKIVRPIGNVHSGISDELRREIFENVDGYVGRIMEVDAMEFNEKGWSLRHGRLKRFRDDKTIEQCTKDGIEIKMGII